MTIGDRIKQLREARGVSQTELADAVGTTKQNIYKYENNVVTNIPSDRIERIAAYFQVSPAYLMGWEIEQDVENTLGTGMLNALSHITPSDRHDDAQDLIQTLYEKFKTEEETQKEILNSSWMKLNSKARGMLCEYAEFLCTKEKYLKSEEFGMFGPLGSRKKNGE